jgi:hypothetical protein
MDSIQRRSYSDHRPVFGVQFVRAIVRAYNATTHTADIELVSGPAALLTTVPVAEAQHLAADLHADDVVLVLLWDDTGAVVLSAYVP